MPVDIISSEIIYECLKEHGKGSRFSRTDGLQFEARRAELRREYLERHPETAPEHREAILQAAVTPGMTKPEVTAAWGLLEEDTRTAFGHVTEDDHNAFAYFTGFAVGESYALCFKDDVVVAVRQTEELVPPHELELEMRLAEETRGLFYFFQSAGAVGLTNAEAVRLTGSDNDHYHGDWIQQQSPASRDEEIVRWSVSEIEQHLKTKGLHPEYLAELERLGLERESLSVAECAGVALRILPYPPLLEKVEQKPILDVRGEPITLRMPPEEWFWHVADGRRREVAFPTIDGRVELLNVQWSKGRLFVLNQIPLLVNGVSQFDLIEAEWQDGEPIPRFKRVVT